MVFKRVFQSLYPTYNSDSLVDQLLTTISGFRRKEKPQLKLAKEKTSVKKIGLTVYPDTFIDRKKNRPSLAVLNEFINQYRLDKYFNILHILPFHPWDTDRGFSVIDCFAVDSQYGSWQDIANLADRFELMSSLVFNHLSIKSPYVQASLILRHIDSSYRQYGEYAPYKNFVIAFSDEDRPTKKDLEKINRPRHAPLLTEYICYEKEGKLAAILGNRLPIGSKFLGRGWVWTTFSRPKSVDGMEVTRQVDLNYQNPQVLLEIVRVLLFYVQKGIKYIRLDAAAMIWKELGTSCSYLPQSYQIINFLRAVLDEVYPEAKLVVEAKTSLEKMKSYLFGKTKKADYVFQYAFFPLYLYCQAKNDFSYFDQWLKKIKGLANKQITTVYGSHDGLELKSLGGVIPNSEIAYLANLLKNKGALANWAVLPGGKKYISEVCSTPWELVGDPQKYLTILAAGLKIPGIADIYINGLLGVDKYFPREGLDENRTVNRERFDIKEITRKLNNKTTREHKIFYEVLERLKISR